MLQLEGLQTTKRTALMPADAAPYLLARRQIQALQQQLSQMLIHQLLELGGCRELTKSSAEGPRVLVHEPVLYEAFDQSLLIALLLQKLIVLQGCQDGSMLSINQQIRHVMLLMR